MTFPSKHQSYFSKAHYVIGKYGQCLGQIRLLYTLIRVTRKSSRLFQVMKTPGPAAGTPVLKTSALPTQLIPPRFVV